MTAAKATAPALFFLILLVFGGCASPQSDDPADQQAEPDKESEAKQSFGPGEFVAVVLDVRWKGREQNKRRGCDVGSSDQKGS